MLLSSVIPVALRRLAVGAVIALVIVAGPACKSDKKSDESGSVPDARTFDATAAAAGEATATPGEAAAAEPEPGFPLPSENAQLTRLVIPAAKINAPLQVKGVNARNEMENPDGKDNVAWYNFTAKPGFGSNAVFSGHVDWFTGEKGVFWHLRDLKEGDELVVRLSDGMELKYHVTTNDVYPSASAPVAEIVGPTSKDTVTLITCEGTFNRAAQDYDKRRVVRAERVA